jgi:hypothetical protein
LSSFRIDIAADSGACWGNGIAAVLPKRNNLLAPCLIAAFETVVALKPPDSWAAIAKD